MSWLGDLLRNRRARKVAKRLAPIALRLLTDDGHLRQVALENMDEAFDQAVTLAANAAGVQLDAETVRLTVCEIELRRVHLKLLSEQRRHDAELERIRERYGR